jgi:hypothetical protein
MLFYRFGLSFYSKDLLAKLHHSSGSHGSHPEQQESGQKQDRYKKPVEVAKS